MKTIAVICLKGGVGKTTLTVNLGAALSFFRKKVLLVDLDPQQDLTHILGFDTTRVKGVEHLLAGEMELPALVRPFKQDMDVIPAGKELKDLEILLARHYKKHAKFGQLLQKAFCGLDQTYDYLLIDCPPSAGLLNINALSFVTNAFIPLQCNYLGLTGAKKTISFVYRMRALYNQQLKIAAIIPTLYQEGKVAEFVAERLKRTFNGKMSETRIRTNHFLAEAPVFGKSIFEYKPLSGAAEDFVRLANEMIIRLG